MIKEADNIALEMANEVRAMAMYALRVGIPVPAWVLETAAQAGAEEAPDRAVPDINRAHGELVRLVDPFTPDLIVMLEMESKVPRFMRALGRTRIERSFMLMAFASIISFVGVSLSHYIKDPRYGEILTSSGLPLLVNEFFYISSAAVGASFSGLFQIDRQLSTGTFLPKNQSSYWVQFILGILAGLLLSTILNVKSIAPMTSEAAGRMHFRNATLALMGGFSSSILQRIVQRLIEALESILSGSAEQELLARDQAGKQRLEETLAKERTRTTLMLVDMQRRLSSGERPEALQALIDKASRAILSNDPLPTQEPPRPAPPAPPPSAAPSTAKEAGAPAAADG